MSEKLRWRHETRWERGMYEPYEVHEFCRGTERMDMIDTEDYLESLEATNTALLAAMEKIKALCMDHSLGGQEALLLIHEAAVNALLGMKE